MPSIRSKILIPLVVIVLLVFLVLEGVLSRQITNRFNLIEEQNLIENGMRVERAFQDEISKLQDKLVEWAQWDAAYEFGQTHNLAPMANDLDPVVLSTSDFDFMLFLDLEQQPFYTLMRGVAPNQTPASYLKLINQLRPQLVGLADTESINGYVLINKQPYLIAASGLHKSNNQGKRSGFLILGRSFGQQKQMGIAERTHLKTWFEASPTQQIKTGIAQSKQNTLILRRVLHDMQGQPSLSLLVEQEHNLQPEAASLQANLRILLGVFVGTTILALLALLEIMVVQPLIRLRGETELARQGNPLHPRVRGRDEIAKLATEIDQLLQRLQSTTSQVHELDVELQECLQMISSKQYRDITERRLSEAASRDRQLFWIRHLQQLRQWLQPTDANTSSKQCENLLNRLNLLVQLESHLDKGKQQPFDVRALCLSLRHQFEPLAQQRGLSLHWHAPDEHLVLLGDETRLRELLSVLLENAVQYTQSGSVGLTCNLTPASGQWQLQFRIQDTGAGIPNDLQQRLLTMMSAPHGHPGRMSSTGLGLQLAVHLSESLDARLAVESQAGIGSTFEVLLCLPEAKAEAQ